MTSAPKRATISLARTAALVRGSYARTLERVMMGEIKGVQDPQGRWRVYEDSVKRVAVRRRWRAYKDSTDRVKEAAK